MVGMLPLTRPKAVECEIGGQLLLKRNPSAVHHFVSRTIRPAPGQTSADHARAKTPHVGQEDVLRRGRCSTTCDSLRQRGGQECVSRLTNLLRSRIEKFGNSSAEK